MHTLKKAFFTTSIIFSLSVQAQFLPLEITNLTGSYQDPVGSAKADQFNIPSSNSTFQQVNIDIFKGNQSYELSVDGEQYLWQDVPQQLMGLESGQWNDINLLSQNKRIELSIDLFRVQTSSTLSALKRASAFCNLSAQVHKSFTDNLLEACLNSRGRLRVDQFSTNSDKNLGQDQLIFTILDSLQGTTLKNPSTQRDVDEIKLDVASNDFELSLSTKVVFNTTVKVEGKSYFEKDKGQIRLRIDKAKAGFLNVKNKLFEALEDSESDKITVNRPWVTLKIK